MGVLRFGQKVMGRMEKATKFGEKALGSAARFGEKVSGKIKGVASAVKNVPILGAVSEAPVFKGHSAQSVASAAAGAIDAGVAAAKVGAEGMKRSGNLIRTGRELGAANTLGEKLAVAKDMARQGQEIQKLR